MKIYDETTGQMVDFHIPDEYQKITVRASGGLDSALALYLTAMLYKDREINVVTCNLNKYIAESGERVEAIMRWINRELGGNCFNFHITYTEETENKNAERINEMFSRGFADVVVSGMTCAPVTRPNESYEVYTESGKLVKLQDDMPLRDRVINAKDERLSWFKSYNGVTVHTPAVNTFYSPFKIVDKKFIAAMYDKFNLHELAKLTDSCEKVPGGHACGECWWCMEKKWAFGYV